MLQKTKNKYTVETLKALNVSYDYDHRLTLEDTDMVNAYVELIEGTRSETTPQVGDRLIFTDRHGSHYGNALIEKAQETGCVYICEEPYMLRYGHGTVRQARNKNTGSRSRTCLTDKIQKS